MLDVRMNAAVRDEAEEMDVPTSLERATKGPDERLVRGATSRRAQRG